ncbi:MAG: undecaprenyl-diphosphate phosphatase [Proteobacteria bacterium]|nr:MAG: undecaprenyl-diphosphate phosphatase [Pseudomonadota bacterium]
MDAAQAIWLALVQGLTEFLPISSSGHLVLVPVLLGWPDQGLAFDVAVHVGSLLAVLAYFRRDLAALIRAVPNALAPGGHRDARLLNHLLLATLPIVAVGYGLNGWVGGHLRDAYVIAASMAGFAVVLWLCDRYGSRRATLEALGWRGALFIGAAQVLALVPGTSRSGITLSAALLVGLTRVDAARFSLLLSIPTIIAAGVLKGAGLARGAGPVDWPVFGIGIAVSAVSAYLCIALFLRVIERIGVAPFVLYRLALGAYLFYVFA